MSDKRVVMQKGVITQTFDETTAKFLESRGWEKVVNARAKPKPEKVEQIVTQTEDK